jgi:hypothetical protein
MKVARIVTSEPYTCTVHGGVIDLMRIDNAGETVLLCSQCLAEALGHKPIFFTNSPHGAEMLATGVGRVSFRTE